jgi:hypothetical protein
VFLTTTSLEQKAIAEREREREQKRECTHMGYLVSLVKPNDEICTFTVEPF